MLKILSVPACFVGSAYFENAVLGFDVIALFLIAIATCYPAMFIVLCL